MKWSDRAIILSARRLGENSAIIGLISPEHGFYKGVDRAAFVKSRRGIYQPGNIVMAAWQARLPEHMGTVQCELLEPVAAKIMDESIKLAVINSAVSLIEKVLAEREKQPELFMCCERVLHALCEGGDYLAEYVRLEFILLACSGFGVDVERCAATGQVHDLAYVSPKSGRAVSKAAGMPYHDRLFALPAFLSQESVPGEPVSMAEIRDGMRLCGYFMNERIFSLRSLPMPSARARLISMLERENA